LWFLNRCRCVTANNIGLSVAVVEPLLIIGISSGSYSKTTYGYNSHTSYNSHTVIIYIQVHTQSQITYNHIHRLTITINIDIAIYNLQSSSSCIICISSSVVHHTQDHISPIYIYSIKSFNKRYQLVGGGRGLRPPLEDYFLHVQTSLLRASSSAFFWVSYFLRASSFFLLALIYRASAALSFLAY
jgi:hypothetical protein